MQHSTKLTNLQMRSMIQYTLEKQLAYIMITTRQHKHGDCPFIIKRERHIRWKNSTAD